MPKIIQLKTYDIRFPTSDFLDGSDAIHKDPDYSAAYLIIKTDSEFEGHSLIFTLGRGNDICCYAMDKLSHLLIGRDLEEITSNIQIFNLSLHADSQLRWLGPEKGVIHMAIGGVINAIYDLWGKVEKKPIWRLLSDLEPQDFIKCVDMRYLSDAMNYEEALEIVQDNQKNKKERIAYLEKNGYPAYTTSAGWLGYPDDKLRTLCKKYLDKGFTHLKIKVGVDLEDDKRRCTIVREMLGKDRILMIDANQVWEIEQAIEWIKVLAVFNPWFIEEPTHPDDIFGHKKIKTALETYDIKVATGEHCQNRILFKQLIQNDALDIVQIDSTRMGGINEILAVYLMAKKYNKIVCPHAGGVGLCEYVQHLSMIDFVQISAEIGDRVLEFADHLHEHFIHPCVLKNGCYVAPQSPGYSIEMKPSSIQKYLYPSGQIWQGRTKK